MLALACPNMFCIFKKGNENQDIGKLKILNCTESIKINLFPNSYFKTSRYLFVTTKKRVDYKHISCFCGIVLVLIETKNMISDHKKVMHTCVPLIKQCIHSYKIN